MKFMQHTPDQGRLFQRAANGGIMSNGHKAIQELQQPSSPSTFHPPRRLAGKACNNVKFWTELPAKGQSSAL